MRGPGRLAFKQLQVSEGRLLAVVDSTGDAVIALDERRALVTANTAAGRPLAEEPVFKASAIA